MVHRSPIVLLISTNNCFVSFTLCNEAEGLGDIDNRLWDINRIFLSIWLNQLTNQNNTYTSNRDIIQPKGKTPQTIHLQLRYSTQSQVKLQDKKE